MPHGRWMSFEYFPPKTPAGLEKFKITAASLAAYQPDFVSVTFGAGGITREGTLQTVQLLQQLTKTAVVPHLSCLGLTRDTLLSILTHYQTIGIQHLVVLRGDLPVGTPPHEGEFLFASEFVRFIRETTGNHFYLDVAAYPEIHPKARSVTDDLLNLKRKYEAGANRAITQYFFNPDAYFYYVEACHRQGIFLPIIPGIMPITNAANLIRFSAQCGAEIPLWIAKRLTDMKDDEASMQAFGLEVIHRLIERLLSGGAPGLHFYTLNQPRPIMQLLDTLGIQATASQTI